MSQIPQPTPVVTPTAPAFTVNMWLARPAAAFAGHKDFDPTLWIRTVPPHPWMTIADLAACPEVGMTVEDLGHVNFDSRNPAEIDDWAVMLGVAFRQNGKVYLTGRDALWLPKYTPELQEYTQLTWDDPRFGADEPPDGSDREIEVLIVNEENAAAPPEVLEEVLVGGDEELLTYDVHYVDCVDTQDGPDAPLPPLPGETSLAEAPARNKPPIPPRPPKPVKPQRPPLPPKPSPEAVANLMGKYPKRPPPIPPKPRQWAKATPPAVPPKGYEGAEPREEYVDSFTQGPQPLWIQLASVNVTDGGYVDATAADYDYLKFTGEIRFTSETGAVTLELPPPAHLRYWRTMDATLVIEDYVMRQLGPKGYLMPIGYSLRVPALAGTMIEFLFRVDGINANPDGSIAEEEMFVILFKRFHLPQAGLSTLTSVTEKKTSSIDRQKDITVTWNVHPPKLRPAQPRTVQIGRVRRDAQSGSGTNRIVVEPKVELGVLFRGKESARHHVGLAGGHVDMTLPEGALEHRRLVGYFADGTRLPGQRVLMAIRSVQRATKPLQDLLPDLYFDSEFVDKEREEFYSARSAEQNDVPTYWYRFRVPYSKAVAVCKWWDKAHADIQDWLTTFEDFKDAPSAGDGSLDNVEWFVARRFSKLFAKQTKQKWTSKGFKPLAADFYRDWKREATDLQDQYEDFASRNLKHTPQAQAVYAKLKRLRIMEYQAQTDCVAAHAAAYKPVPFPFRLLGRNCSVRASESLIHAGIIPSVKGFITNPDNLYETLKAHCKDGVVEEVGYFGIFGPKYGMKTVAKYDIANEPPEEVGVAKVLTEEMSG